MFIYFHLFLTAVTDGHGYQSIHDAVRNSDVLHLEAMVKNGASINEVEDRDKFTPVHTACNVGALEVSSVIIIIIIINLFFVSRRFSNMVFL